MLQISVEDRQWAETTWEKISVKMLAQCERLGASFPYASIDGHYSCKKNDNMSPNVYWWTNGFWPGILWLMYNASGDNKYLQTARAIEEKLDGALSGFEGLHHDVGFMWTLASVLDFRLTGDNTARRRALHAANILAGRFNPRGKFIRAWNRDCTGWIIIDSMMNLSLLYWAGRQTNDPRFAFIAEDHADTAMRCLVREDGSCNHIAVLDPLNGTLVETPAGQGYASGSSWTRGQAWAMYGFALTYLNSGHIRYLETSRRIAKYFCGKIARHGFVPPVDFRSPDNEEKIIDTSAGVIASCALLTLYEISHNDSGQTENANQYLRDAVNILKTIESKYCDYDPSADGLVRMATAQYHNKLDERHVSLIYGDYFFMEAVNRLRGKEIKIWQDQNGK